MNELSQDLGAPTRLLKGAVDAAGQRPRSVAHAVFTSELRCVQADQGYAALFGEIERDELIGRAFRDINPGLTPSESRRVALLLGASGPRTAHVYLHLRADGRGGVRLWQFSYRRVRIGRSSGLAVAGLDVTAQAARLTERYHEAGDDTLGVVATRTAFRSALSEAVRRHRGGGACPGLLLVDLAPPLEAAWPHDQVTRDVALLAVARRLRSNVREGDLVGRQEGGRFAVLIADVTTAFPVADRLRDVLGLLLSLAAGVPLPGAMLGAVVAQPGESGEAMVRRARAGLDPVIIRRVDAARERSVHKIDGATARRLIAGIAAVEAARPRPARTSSKDRIIDLRDAQPLPRPVAESQDLPRRN